MYKWNNIKWNLKCCWTLLNNDSDELVNQVLTGSLNKQNESDFPMLSSRANFSDAHKEAFVNVVCIVFFSLRSWPQWSTNPKQSSNQQCFIRVMFQTLPLAVIASIVM